MIVSKFVQCLDETFRVLLEVEPDGGWLISYENPTTPFFVEVLPERCEAPKDFLEQKMPTAVSLRKMAMLKDMISDDCCIRDKKLRNKMAAEIAAQFGTTSRTVLRLYYRYLATGSVSKIKSANDTIKRDNTIFNWAIHHYYFSAKRFSLKTTYQLMLLSKYSTADGELVEHFPSWNSFRHYFYDCGFHKDPSASISREGLGNYLRNNRSAFGSAKNWKPYIGAYQVDAQEADIYLVSSLDRKTPISRPIIYLAVDTATEAITALYVSTTGEDDAVMRLISIGAADKVDFCRKFDIEIEKKDWPCVGLPSQIISDKGSDFCSRRVEELARRYSVQLESVPPFRSELKPIIERTFGLLQSQYLDILRGKGVIEADATERWSINYRSQAVLTIREFTQILILAILQTNRRVLPCGKTPLQLWEEKQDTARLLPVKDKDLYLISLPRGKTAIRLTRKGIRFNNLNYAPVSMDGLYIGDKYEVAWDPENVSIIYLCISGGYVSCELSKDSRRYIGLSQSEVAMRQKAENEEIQKLHEEELVAKVRTLHQMKQIIKAAEKECGR